MADKKLTRVKFKIGSIYEDLFWNPGGVVDMTPDLAEYLEANGIVAPTKDDLTPRPSPLTVPEKETATSVANAIAAAIAAAQPAPELDKKGK